MRLLSLLFMTAALQAQTIPTLTGTFTTSGKTYSYTRVGAGTIPTIVVPVSVSLIKAKPAIGKLLRSPIFRPFSFSGGKMQFGDALLSASSGRGTQC